MNTILLLNPKHYSCVFCRTYSITVTFAILISLLQGMRFIVPSLTSWYAFVLPIFNILHKSLIPMISGYSMGKLASNLNQYDYNNIKQLSKCGISRAHFCSG